MDRALELLEGLLKLQRSHGDEVGVAGTYAAIADVYFKQADSLPDPESKQNGYKEALRLRRRAHKGYADAGALRHAAVVRSQLGRELFLAGQDHDALLELQGAFEDCVALGDLSGAATCTQGLAMAFLSKGLDGGSQAREYYEQAMGWASKGLAYASDFGLDLADGDGEEGRARRLMSLIRIGTKAAYQLRDAAQLYRFYDMGRAAGLLAALGGREALREVSVPADLRAAEEKARAEVTRALDARQALGRGASLKASRRVTAAQKGVREALKEIRDEVRMQADLSYPQVPPLKEVQGYLRAGDALLLYGEVFDKIVVVVVTGDDVWPVDIAPAEKVRDAVQALFSDDEYPINEGRAGKLRELLLDKLKLGADVKRLLISPHGSLAYVPFSLLDASREVCFLPSATVFAALRADTYEAGQRLLALGAPAYKGEHPDLPESGTEVSSIAIKERGDTVLLGEDASETNFKRLVAEKEKAKERWRAVHLACHGLVYPERPRESALALTVDEENDGSLEALEVFGMRVPADLVVLSGCETGSGQIIEGEGLEGFTRAFLFAGTPRVIASLWNVDDEATQVLMTEFYRLWRPLGKPGTLPAAAALKAAQAHVKNHPDHPLWKHPHYWAAWVLWGLPD